MTFQEIALIDVRVAPQPTGDTFQFQFVLSRIPERFWPECFTGAYNARSGRRRIEVSEDSVRIALPEDEVEEYATLIGQVVAQANSAYQAELARRVSEQQRRIDEEEQRQANAVLLQQRAKRLLGL